MIHFAEQYKSYWIMLYKDEQAKLVMTHPAWSSYPMCELKS